MPLSSRTACTSDSLVAGPLAAAADVESTRLSCSPPLPSSLQSRPHPPPASAQHRSVRRPDSGGWWEAELHALGLRHTSVRPHASNKQPSSKNQQRPPPAPTGGLTAFARGANVAPVHHLTAHRRKMGRCGWASPPRSERHTNLLPRLPPARTPCIAGGCHCMSQGHPGRAPRPTPPVANTAPNLHPEERVLVPKTSSSDISRLSRWPPPLQPLELFLASHTHTHLQPANHAGSAAKTAVAGSQSKPWLSGEGLLGRTLLHPLWHPTRAATTLSSAYTHVVTLSSTLRR